MPTLNADQIKAEIAAGSIFGISVDTSIFDRYGCNLNYASLRKLDQFHGGQFRVLLSDVVRQELYSHICRAAGETQGDLQKAIKAHQRRWGLSDQDAAAPAGFQLQGDPDAVAQQQVASFVAATGAEIISATDPNTIAEEVIRRYFATEAPFEANAKKKNEFPDAFALVSLETRAEAANRKIICVSADTGWTNFAEQSAHLVCMDDLELALSLFNDAGVVVAQRTVGLLRAGTAPETLAAIDNALEYRLDDCDWDIEANAPVSFDAEPAEAIAQSIDGTSASDPIVIASDEDSVTFTTTLRAIVGFEASFSYSVRDWIDKDYVSLGSENEYVEQEIEFEIALTVDRTEEGEPEILEVEVAKQRFTVDFGYVEPFANEDPTHEKY